MHARYHASPETGILNGLFDLVKEITNLYEELNFLTLQ
jgi:hypothetical protein